MIKHEDLKNIKIEEIEIKEYVPMIHKMAVANLLLKSVVSENEHGVYTYNTNLWEMTKDVAFISTYTNIEITDNDYENYDAVKSSGILEAIKDHFYELNNDEYWDFHNVCDNALGDLLEQNSVENIVAKKTTQVVSMIDRTMGHLDNMLDKGDPNKIAKYLSKGVEMVAAKLPDFSKVDVFEKIK